jgi:F-type H+-transporting ATPase subunit epsilon
MIKFELITPERVVMTEEIYEAILPAQTGQIAVLPGHVPMITLLKPGVIALRRQKNDPDTKLEHLATSGGFVEITGNSIKLMADTAERADELDELRIKEAKEEAKRQLKGAKDEVSYTEAIGRIEVELARERVKNIKRRHGSRVDVPDSTD